ncbi:acetyl-coenzyme A synthetase N-terminal domain-containing protein, partial [Burkholderia multivorans]
MTHARDAPTVPRVVLIPATAAAAFRRTPAAAGGGISVDRSTHGVPAASHRRHRRAGSAHRRATGMHVAFRSPLHDTLRFSTENTLTALVSILHERRIFEPTADTRDRATLSGMQAYRALAAEAERDYEGFWARLAREGLAWHKPFTKVLDESDAPFYKWFDDGELNASYNCLDRHVE